jgi:hypothetical protein
MARAAPDGKSKRAYGDMNIVVGGFLRDLAFVQESRQKMFGYKRAAAAILSLPSPLTDLMAPDGTLPRIKGIGPGSHACQARAREGVHLCAR